MIAEVVVGRGEVDEEEGELQEALPVAGAAAEAVKQEEEEVRE